MREPDADHHDTLARVHWRAGQLVEAEEKARRAIELLPVNAKYHARWRWFSAMRAAWTMLRLRPAARSNWPLATPSPAALPGVARRISRRVFLCR